MVLNAHKGHHYHQRKLSFDHGSDTPCVHEFIFIFYQKDLLELLVLKVFTRLDFILFNILIIVVILIQIIHLGKASRIWLPLNFDSWLDDRERPQSSWLTWIT